MIDYFTYYYKIIPFNLKNMGTTHQRIVNKVVVDLIRKIIEAYVDDTVIKSLYSSDRIFFIKWVFNTLRHYQMKLSLIKCSFGIFSTCSLILCLQ